MTFFKSNWKLLLFLFAASLMITFAVTHQASAQGIKKTAPFQAKRARAQKQEPRHTNPSVLKANPKRL